MLCLRQLAKVNQMVNVPENIVTIAKQLQLSSRASAVAAGCRRQRSSVAAIDLTATGSQCPFAGSRRSSRDEIAVGQAVKVPAAIGGSSSSYDAIPSPKGLPILGTTLDVIKHGGAPKIHEYCTMRHQQLGPIYKEKLGAVEAVFIADSQMIQKVYKNEGKHPQHMVPEPWLIYNEIAGVQRGLFFMDGPQWEERRRSLNKVFLRPQTISTHTGMFNDVITDVLERWGSSTNENNVLPDLEKELYNWSIESLGAMIFGRRLGCIKSKEALDISIHEFVHCVQQIFTESAKMTMIPPRLAYKLKLPVWNRFAKAAGKAIELAKLYVEDNVANSANSECEDGILHQLLRENISVEEIVRIVTDLFVAAADTTSHATQWTLYMLAKNKDCQSKLLSEVNNVVPNGELIKEEHLSSLPYVKAVIKEALRLYPVAPFLTRILSNELNIGQYNVPAGKLVLMSLYTTGRDPKYFSNPTEFKPERWIRKKDSKEVINTHACLPFGLGARSCIGRRVAEVQMQFLIARIVQKFDFEATKDVDIAMRMITTPSEPISLRLTPRA